MKAATRTIHEHKVNPSNDTVAISVLDEPGHGGANHEYLCELPNGDKTLIHFQNGPINEAGIGVNGMTHEVLLAIVADRLRSFQAGPYACVENAGALIHIQVALDCLHMRTKARMDRGVEGTHTV